MAFQNRQRRWGVYEATGNPSKPLRLVACIRANAKSIAVGTVHRARNIPKRELVAVEGCDQSQHAYKSHVFRGARRRKRRR